MEGIRILPAAVRRVAVPALACITFGAMIVLGARRSVFAEFDPATVGDAVLRGALPYRDFPMEYPPGTALVFAIPALVSTPASYMGVFRTMMLGTWASLGLAVGRVTPTALVGYFACTLAWAWIIPSAYDIVVAVCVYASFCACVSDRTLRSSLWLALGVLVKWVPGVLGPLLLRTSTSRRRITAAAILAITTVATIALPAAIARPGGDPIAFHRARPMHAEAMVGSAVVLSRAITGSDSGITYASRSRAVTGVGAWGRIASIGILTLALGLLWILGDPRSPATWTASLLAIPAFGPVASPQFFLWPLPLVGFLSRATRSLFALAGVISLIYFTLVERQRSGDLFPAAMMASRNAVAIAAVVAAGIEGRATRSHAPSTVNINS